MCSLLSRFPLHSQPTTTPTSFFADAIFSDVLTEELQPLKVEAATTQDGDSVNGPVSNPEQLIRQPDIKELHTKMKSLGIGGMETEDDNKDPTEEEERTVTKREDDTPSSGATTRPEAVGDKNSGQGGSKREGNDTAAAAEVSSGHTGLPTRWGGVARESFQQNALESLLAGRTVCNC